METFRIVKPVPSRGMMDMNNIVEFGRSMTFLMPTFQIGQQKLTEEAI